VNVRTQNYVIIASFWLFIYTPFTTGSLSHSKLSDFSSQNSVKMIETVSFNNLQTSRHHPVYALYSVTYSSLGSGIHPVPYPMGTRDSFPEVRRQGREADHSPPSSAEAKKAWIYISTPQYAFMA